LTETGYRGLGWGDFDNDGDIDLVARDPDIFNNTGGGTWDTNSPTPTQNDEVAMWADIDGDGDLDIWDPGASYLWYTNTGAGTFTPEDRMPGAGSAYSPSLSKSPQAYSMFSWPSQHPTSSGKPIAAKMFS